VPARQRTRAGERSPPRGYMSPVTRIPAEFRSPTLEPDASCWPFQAILRRWLSQPKVGILAALDLAAALPWNLLYLTTQNACAIIGPAKYLSKSNLVLSQPFCVQSALQSARLLMDKCQVLVQEQLGVIAAFLRPVHVTKREVIDGQVPGCVLSRTLVRSRERDHCFRVKITSFSMKQTSAPGLGGAPGGAPSPLGWTGVRDGRSPGERDGPLFPKKSTTSQPSKQTSALSPSRPRPLWGGPLPVLQVRVASHGTIRSRDRAIALSLDVVGLTLSQQRIAATHPMIGKRLVVTRACWNASPGAGLAAALPEYNTPLDSRGFMW
jgi:hypothetical protein